MTWRYALLSFTIGVLFMVAQTAFAHDHPPPTDCPSTCVDRQCRCVDTCNKMGAAAGADCFRDCYDQKQDCLKRCDASIRGSNEDAPEAPKHVP